MKSNSHQPELTYDIKIFAQDGKYQVCTIAICIAKTHALPG